MQQPAKVDDGIRVEIYDQTYQMRGQLDPEYIRNLAAYVDSKMRSIAAHTRTIDSLRVAILAALNIADECYQLRAKHDAASREVNERLGLCSSALDKLLGE